MARSKRRTPRLSYKILICFMSEIEVIKISSAALFKLPNSAAFINDVEFIHAIITSFRVI